MAKETGFFRGAGGGVFEMDLPLPDPYQDQIAKRTLVRVNADGSDFTGDAAGAAEGAAVTERPSVNAPKSAWIGWAVHNGADLEDAAAATKQDLVDTYGNGRGE